jgi:plastocyanin
VHKDLRPSKRFDSFEPDHEPVSRWPVLDRRREGARIVVVAMGLWFGVHALPATAGRLEGNVTLTPRAAAPQEVHASINPYAGSMGSMCTGMPAAHKLADDARDVVIFLEGAPAGATAAAHAANPNPQLAQRGQAFEPHVLGVPAGTTVDFPNLDPIFHNVFSYSKTKRFDLGKYGQGKSASVRFDKPGLVKVFCDIHSTMTAFIYVADTPWVVQPDATGHFVLDGLPDGNYTLKLWHPERGTTSQAVSVTGSGTHVDLTL